MKEIYYCISSHEPIIIDNVRNYHYLINLVFIKTSDSIKSVNIRELGVINTLYAVFFTYKYIFIDENFFIKIQMVFLIDILIDIN